MDMNTIDIMMKNGGIIYRQNKSIDRVSQDI
jgi:hypothetical protein